MGKVHLLTVPICCYCERVQGFHDLYENHNFKPMKVNPPPMSPTDKVFLHYSELEERTNKAFWQGVMVSTIIDWLLFALLLITLRFIV